MECPHLTASVCIVPDAAAFPSGCPSSWCCSVCRSNKSPWVCLTCSSVHCGRYVNGHAKKHYEEAQAPLPNHKQQEKVEKEKTQHTVCMDCSSYSTYCYRCDDFVINDTKLCLVQKVREHLQNLENSAFTAERHRKRKLLDNPSLNKKNTQNKWKYLCNLCHWFTKFGKYLFYECNTPVAKFSCYFIELPAVELRNGKTAGRRTYHTRSQGEVNVSLVEEFRKTLCSLWQGNQTAFSPESLFYVVWKIMPSFRGYQQQDAHEFMRYLLDHLHLELQGDSDGSSQSLMSQETSNRSSSSKCCINGANTVVTSVFGGILQNEVNCLICGTESRKFDPFLDLSLDIPSQFRNKRKNQENGPTCTLKALQAAASVPKDAVSEGPSMMSRSRDHDVIAGPTLNAFLGMEAAACTAESRGPSEGPEGESPLLQTLGTIRTAHAV
ncbi:unnamed protein product [Ranitomeya imitator]|uniref:ubiquitinyl hydrolase 1 n=1 Tax=Ranitomeya imitator TaxID=111125 RepID=A0ABN9KZ03_9NEOB|nr:unnamed protein product [Ranitomeya imitator]